MTDQEFEQLLKQALIVSTRRDWIEHPPDETLDLEASNTQELDERIRQIKHRLAAKKEPKRLPLIRKLGRIAAMFLLTISLFFGALMLHPEARAYIVNLVVTWYEDHIKYTFQEDGAAEIPKEWTFGYIPEGFELYFEEDRETNYVFLFENEDGALLSIFISNESGSFYTDNEHFTITRSLIRGSMAEFYEAKDGDPTNMIVWHREDVHAFVELVGDMPIEEIVLVAEGLTP